MPQLISDPRTANKTFQKAQSVNSPKRQLNSFLKEKIFGGGAVFSSSFVGRTTNQKRALLFFLVFVGLKNFWDVIVPFLFVVMVCCVFGFC